MKHLLTLCLLAITMCAVAQTKKTVAVLDAVDKQGNIPTAYLSMIRNTMITAVTNTTDYEAYDRTSLDAIASEQNFQRSGHVDDEQIKRLGKMAGVDYVLVTEADAVDGWLTMIVKILNVETAKYEKAIDSDFLEMKPQIVQAGVRDVASKLFGGSSVYTTSPTSQTPQPQKTLEPGGTEPSANNVSRNKVAISLFACIQADKQLIDGVKVEYKIVSNTSEVASTDYLYWATSKVAYSEKNGKPALFNVFCVPKDIAEQEIGINAYMDAIIKNRQEPIFIQGLTSANCSNVSIIIRLSKEGFISQEKRFNLKEQATAIAKNNAATLKLITELRH